MKTQLHVPPLRWWAIWLDVLFTPLMYLLAGTLKETPQQTHYWNNKKFPRGLLQRLDSSLMAQAKASRTTLKSRCGFLFHAPILGGWRSYVVLQPEVTGAWHVGWITQDVCGVSQLPLFGPVRLLRGPYPVQFFAVRASDGLQIPLRIIAKGRIGRRGRNSDLPLL